MKVLDDNNFIKVDCGRCHSKLGVHERDITFHEIPHRTTSFTATCGACGATVNVPDAAIPFAWKRRLVPADM